MNDSFRYCPDPYDCAETASSRPDSATSPTPAEGQLGTVTLDELFFILSKGALGVKPQRAQPPTTRPRETSTED